MAATAAAGAALLLGLIFSGALRLGGFQPFRGGRACQKFWAFRSPACVVIVFSAASVCIRFPVSFIGTIAFVGLVAPHCAETSLGDDQRCALHSRKHPFRDFIMLLSSLVAKWLSAGAMLPIGIVTSIAGVPFLLVLLCKEPEGLLMTLRLSLRTSVLPTAAARFLKHATLTSRAGRCTWRAEKRRRQNHPFKGRRGHDAAYRGRYAYRRQ
ncbi:MAG: iron chelate uptake ABC transporter family permease subunit [Duodenibacillus massiliensis]